jgi:ABC-type transport system substrate-binding protein
MSESFIVSPPHRHQWLGTGPRRRSASVAPPNNGGQERVTLDQNTLLSHSTAAWNTTRHIDAKVDDYYLRYAREMDPGKRKAIAKEFQEFMTDKLYWNTISGSPFYEVAQPWMKDYVYNAEWKVLYKKVWLDK